MVEAFARTVQLLESRIPEFEGHSARVAGISASVAEQLGLPADEVDDVRVAGLLHDLGMLAIPDEFLTRPGTLSRVEYEKIQAHPRIGASLVHRFPSLHRPAVNMAFHHERWDGTGYPKGLRGSAIPYGAQIVGIAEVYAGLIGDRGHKDSMSPSEALDTLMGAEGMWFQRAVVVALARAVDGGAASGVVLLR